MVALENSIQASDDDSFQIIQQIVRLNYKRFDNEPKLVDEFLQLCSDNFTFVESWDDNTISTSTMRLYSKKVPAREASRQFVDIVRCQVNEKYQIKKIT